MLIDWFHFASYDSLFYYPSTHLIAEKTAVWGAFSNFSRMWPLDFSPKSHCWWTGLFCLFYWCRGFILSALPKSNMKYKQRSVDLGRDRERGWKEMCWVRGWIAELAFYRDPFPPAHLHTLALSLSPSLCCNLPGRFYPSNSDHPSFQ